MDHAVTLVGLQRVTGAPGREAPCRLPLPALALAANFADFHMGVALGERAEGSSGLDGLELFGITHQNHLCAAPLGFAEDPFHLAGADHPGFVDHQHVPVTEKLAPLRPLVLQAGNGARGDS